MTQQQINEFNKNIQKVSNGKLDTFNEIINIFINLIKLETSANYDTLIQRIEDLNQNNSIKDIQQFLDNYFKFSNSIIVEFDEMGKDISDDISKLSKLSLSLAKKIVKIIPKNNSISSILNGSIKIIEHIYSDFNIEVSNDLDILFKNITVAFNEQEQPAQFFFLFCELPMILEDVQDINNEDLEEMVASLITVCVFVNSLRKLKYIESVNTQDYQSQFYTSTNNIDYNVGRNDKCPCGSGKKYKKCCLNKKNQPLQSIKPIACKPEYNKFTKAEINQFYMIWSRFLNFVNKVYCQYYGFKYHKIYDKNKQTNKYFITDETLEDNYYLNFRSFLNDNFYMLVDHFLDENRVSMENITILQDIRDSYKFFKFYNFESFENGDAIFWDTANSKCYYVSKLSFDYSQTIPKATLCEAMFFHYKGRIIMDGMAVAYEAELGSNAQEMLKNGYENDRKSLKYQLEENKRPKAIIYQLKISIKGAKSPIWRRVLVKSTISFSVLHTIIQNIFNWENYHLYQFDGNQSYTDANSIQEALDHDPNLKDAVQYNISQELRTEKDKISYTYDFGDDWEHVILLEKILEEDKSIDYPICTAGKRHRPLEDCGGIWVYNEIVQAIETEQYDELDYLLDEDGSFYYKGLNPSYFDKDEINKRLRYI
jgi:hypothetical protein